GGGGRRWGGGGGGEGWAEEYTAAELAHVTPGIRSLRRLTASKTLTVPTTLTRAPSAGSARQNGTCSAARWITRVIPWASSRRSRAPRSVMSPRSSVSSAICPGGMINRSRPVSSPRSYATTRSPSSSRVLIVHAPMQPSAPVTSQRSSGKRGVLVHRDELCVELDRGAALLVRPPA